MKKYLIHIKLIITAFLMLSLFSCTKPKLIDSEYGGYYRKGKKVVFHKPANVFNNDVPVKGADIESFEVVYYWVAKDKNQVYYQEEPQPLIDVESFRFDKGVLKDKKRVYQREYLELKAVENPDIHPASFEALDWFVEIAADGRPNKNTFYKDQANYYFKYQTLDVDYATFRPINEVFLADKNEIYAFVHRSKFESLGTRSEDFQVINTNTVFNHGKIYFIGDEIHSLVEYEIGKLDTLESLSADMVRVNDLILYQGKAFSAPNYDVESFQFIGKDIFGGTRIYTKDKNQVYINEAVLENADPASFELIETISDYDKSKGTTVFSKDYNRVYYKDQIIPSADPRTFEYVGWEYAKDQHRVYFRDKVLDGADAASFHRDAHNPKMFVDKNHQWNFLGEQIK
jgi:hypothetical protein